MKSDFLVTENTGTEPEHTESAEPSVASICFSVHSVSRSLLRLLRFFAAKRIATLGLFALTVASLPAQENPVTESTVALVPAGGEITRSYSASQVSVRMVSRPYFSPAPAGWPALEVGPASLTFVRDSAGGALVLLGDQPLSLPFAIALGQDGRSVQPLDFTLGYDQPKATATLTLSGQDFSLAATAPAGPIPVVVAAGTATDWPITALEITPGVADTNASDTSTNTQSPGAKSAATDSNLQSLAEATEQRLNLAAAVKKGELTPKEALEQLRKAPSSGLEIGADGDFGLAAFVVGESLVGAGKYSEAEPFFQAAETALAAAIKESIKKNEQAIFLKTLAWIRFRYLRKPDQARSDIEAAYQLNSEDGNLRRIRARLTGIRESR